MKSTLPSHLRPTTSSHNKQIRRISKFPEKENNLYFTLGGQTTPSLVARVQSNDHSVVVEESTILREKVTEISSTDNY